MKRFKMNRKSLLFVLFSLILACSGSRDSTIEESAFTDQRDGRTYKTARIGDQVWMAENLNYGKVVKDCDQQNNGIVEKTFYKNDSTIGAVYGGLYTWDEAMNWQHSESNQGICPEGWHLPTLAEWRQLSQFLGVDSAGQQLKASKTDSIPWDGNNNSKFTAIPSGVAYQKYFGRKGHWAVYWTSTEYDSAYAWFAQLDGFWYPQPPKYKILYLGNYYLKENAFCIRCIKDKEK
jgi:uncharacterized protein (TIGR02145 family)